MPAGCRDGKVFVGSSVTAVLLCGATEQRKETGEGQELAHCLWSLGLRWPCCPLSSSSSRHGDLEAQVELSPVCWPYNMVRGGLVSASHGGVSKHCQSFHLARGTEAWEAQRLAQFSWLMEGARTAVAGQVEGSPPRGCVLCCCLGK